MYILTKEHKEYIFYVYTNFDVRNKRLVKKRILFLPGITIATVKENLENNLSLTAYVLEKSARIQFKNDKIRFGYSVKELENFDMTAMLAEMMGKVH